MATLLDFTCSYVSDVSFSQTVIQAHACYSKLLEVKHVLQQADDVCAEIHELDAATAGADSGYACMWSDPHYLCMHARSQIGYLPLVWRVLYTYSGGLLVTASSLDLVCADWLVIVFLGTASSWYRNAYLQAFHFIVCLELYRSHLRSRLIDESVTAASRAVMDAEASQSTFLAACHIESFDGLVGLSSPDDTTGTLGVLYRFLLSNYQCLSAHVRVIHNLRWNVSIHTFTLYLGFPI